MTRDSNIVQLFEMSKVFFIETKSNGAVASAKIYKLDDCRY